MFLIRGIGLPMRRERVFPWQASTMEVSMAQPSYNELNEKFEWAKVRVNQLELECESWRNQALLAQAKLRTLENENTQLKEKLAQSLPLYDPDEFLPLNEAS